MNFDWPLRVYYEDTDSGGVVYHTNYLKYMERARTEFLRQLGYEQDELIENHNLIFAVHSIQSRFIYPACFNEKLIVNTQVTELKKASMLFQQIVHREGQVDKQFCVGNVRIACLKADTFKPQVFPGDMYQAFKNTLNNIPEENPSAD